MASYADCKIVSPGRVPRSTSFDWRRKGCAVIVALMMYCATTATICAEELWIFEPYQVKVWVAIEPTVVFPAHMQVQLQRRLRAQLAATVGSPYRATVETIPQSLAGKVLSDLSLVDAEAMKAVASDLTRFDKVIIVTVTSDGADARIRSREYDLRSREWSPISDTPTAQMMLLPEIAFDSILAVFRPLFRVKGAYETIREEPAIDGGDPKKIKLDMVECELRAGGLAGDGSAPIVPAVGDVLQPYLRRNSRSGRVSGVDPIAYTYCIVRQRVGASYFCEVRSARGRGAVGSSGGRRTEQFALAPPAPFANTVLQISTLAAEPQPLSGYEIWDQNIDTGKAELLGATDWQGKIPVPYTSDRPLKLLYVRNGGRLLARLPVAPGVKREVVAALPDDEMRLNAESVIKGFQARLMDVMALRQVLSSRVRSRIKSGDLPLAESLIEDFRNVDSKRELTIELDRYQKDFSTGDRRLQLKIRGMFVETQSLIDRFIDSTVASKLAAELADARRSAEGN